MINEVIIYSDGTVNSFDADNCQVASATGDWSIIPLLVEWAMAQYPSQLPEECRMINCSYYFGVRKKGGDDRIQIPVQHLIKISKFIGTQGYQPREARIDDIPQSEN